MSEKWAWRYRPPTSPMGLGPELDDWLAITDWYNAPDVNGGEDRVTIVWWSE